MSAFFPFLVWLCAKAWIVSLQYNVLCAIFVYLGNLSGGKTEFERSSMANFRFNVITITDLLQRSWFHQVHKAFYRDTCVFNLDCPHSLWPSQQIPDVVSTSANSKVSQIHEWYHGCFHSQHAYQMKAHRPLCNFTHSYEKTWFSQKDKVNWRQILAHTSDLEFTIVNPQQFDCLKIVLISLIN